MLVIPFMQVPAQEAETPLRLDQESFRAFYDDALPRVYGYFLHRCGGSVAVAEDLTQDTFLAAVAELKKERRVKTPVAWVYGIARHKLLDHYRRQERSVRTVRATPARETYERELVVDDTSEARDAAIAALASVAAAQRAALVMCYIDGFSVPEAARMLGRSVEAVESLLARGQQSFKRTYLEEREPA
jgi:RNA polymerase sigma-70 factor, ECF subfamily